MCIRDSTGTGAGLDRRDIVENGIGLGRADRVPQGFQPVSYTHLDVYKRQGMKKETTASTASAAALADFRFRGAPAPKPKNACWDNPRPCLLYTSQTFLNAFGQF